MAWQRGWSDRHRRLPPDWRERRASVLRRDRGVCQIAGPGCKHRATEVDHIEHGDNHDLSNLQAACVHCHRTKTAGEGATASAQSRRQDAALRYRPARPHPGRRVPPSAGA